MPPESNDDNAASRVHAALRTLASIYYNWDDVANVADLEGFPELELHAALHQLSICEVAMQVQPQDHSKHELLCKAFRSHNQKVIMFENASGRGNFLVKLWSCISRITVIGLLWKYMHVLVQSSRVTPAVVSMYQCCLAMMHVLLLCTSGDEC
jgi:hypothetical protein